jgi:zona occludens toxin
MLTILTGTPGNGKTAHALDLLYFDKNSIWFPLEKYVDGIAELKLEHFEFPDIKLLKSPQYVPLSQVDSEEYAVWLPDNPHYPAFVEARATAKTAWDLWFLWATPESVLVIDEAQRYMRPKPSGAPVPLAIQMIEYHRHFGIHMFFITQKERLLHSNVRMLAGQHIHLTDGWRGRHRFEWPECKDSDSKSEKQLSAHDSYKLPTHVFPFYKSTVSVLKTGHKTPFFVYMMIAAGLTIPVFGYFIYKSFTKPKTTVAAASATSASGQITQASGVPAALPFSASGVDAAPVTDSASYMTQFKPIVSGRPETAPAFSKLREVVAMPVISACLQSAAHCYCYTQQGSRIFDMTEESCHDYVLQGVHFNPYQRVQSSAVGSASAFARPAIATASAGSESPFNAPVVQNVPEDRSRIFSRSVQ